MKKVSRRFFLYIYLNSVLDFSNLGELKQCIPHHSHSLQLLQLPALVCTFSLTVLWIIPVLCCSHSPTVRSFVPLLHCVYTAVVNSESLLMLIDYLFFLFMFADLHLAIALPLRYMFSLHETLPFVPRFRGQTSCFHIRCLPSHLRMNPKPIFHLLR